MTPDQFLQIAEALPDACLLVSGDGIVLALNRRLASYLERTPAELTNQPFAALISTSAMPLDVFLRLCARTHDSVPMTVTCVGRSESCRIVGALLQPRSGANAALIMVSIRGEDLITIRFSALSRKIEQLNREIERRKSSEAALQQHTMALRLADRRKNEFLAMLGHELRNPLVPIRSGLELLRINPGDQDTLAVMQQHVEHIVRLVDDLLDVARITRGKIELRKQTLCLTTLVQRALASARTFIDSRQQQLQVSLTEVALWVEADPVRLLQVLGNLLHNAAKYTPAHGCITLETTCENNQAIIRIRDDGIGIERKSLAAIFDLFTQLEPSMARSEGGLGIGLTISKEIIERHGGQIEASSAGSGQGSQFTVRLPLVAAPARPAPAAPVAQAPAATAAPSGQARCLRVLIVDDNQQSAQLMGRLLTAVGPDKIELAYDGETALAVATAFQPDVIFLDIGLPDLDGFEVARRLRAQAGFATTLLVAVTGYGSEDDRRMSRDVGFDLHLVKPVTVDQLSSVLDAARQQAQ
ncbi:MAG: ATP-binding protein [Gammaproteobacteria bacterium]